MTVDKERELMRVMTGKLLILTRDHELTQKVRLTTKFLCIRLFIGYVFWGKTMHTIRPISIFLCFFLVFSTMAFAGGRVRVNGYFRKDGTYVQPHYRSAPDGNFYNNWSTKGNFNPYTGKEGTAINPPSGYSSSAHPSSPVHYPSGTIYESSSNNLSNSKIERANFWKSKGYNFNSDYMTASMIDTKVRDIERASFWKAQGYNFNPDYMTASMMDTKVRDIERANFWNVKGYNFNPDYMTASMMDTKVRDIERANFWNVKGYNFNPDYMTASMMDTKVRDIERANFWKSKGYNFNPDYMTASMMDTKVRDIERANFWKSKGYNFNPDYMTASMMDTKVRDIERAINLVPKYR